jgi:three-Cys-motif partner protein
MGQKSRDYIMKRVDGLTEDSESIVEQAPGVANDFDSWSALKLILHSAVVNMYTTVMSDNSYFKNYYYVDALAGSGVSEYEEGQCFIGSPIIAAKAAREPFSKMFFIEEDEEFAKALRKRLNHVFTDPSIDIREPEEWEVIQGDANDELPEVAEEIKRRGQAQTGGYNYFCMVDNQGLNVDWPAIESLTPTPYGDLLINFPTSQAVGRNAVREETGALNDFFGTDIQEDDLPIDDPEREIRPFLREKYLSRLADRDRPIQETTQVRSGVGSFFYDMIYATRDIDGGNGYIKVVEYVKEFVEDVNGGDVDQMIQIIEGNQSTVNSFMPSGDIDEKIPDDEVEESPQTGLGDW